MKKKKTKAMIVNFTERQFSTRLVLNQKSIDIVDRMKILGTTINNKLELTNNCQELAKKVNKQMVFLRKILGFGENRNEMVQLWKTDCRSVLFSGSSPQRIAPFYDGRIY